MLQGRGGLPILLSTRCARPRSGLLIWCLAFCVGRLEFGPPQASEVFGEPVRTQKIRCAGPNAKLQTPNAKLQNRMPSSARPARSAQKVRAPRVFPKRPLCADDKPDSVPATCVVGDDHFSHARPKAREPTTRAGARAASATITRRLSACADGPDAGPPVMSCTAEGFSCPAHCCAGGGLLPRLFTLTRRCSREKRRAV